MNRKPVLGKFADIVTTQGMGDWQPFLSLTEVHVDDAEALIVLGGAAAAELVRVRLAKDLRGAEAGSSVIKSALRIMSGQRPPVHLLHVFAAAAAAQSILLPAERLQLASMLRALAGITAEDQPAVLRLAVDQVPAGATGARLAEIGLAEKGRPTRIGKVFASALVVVHQLVPELDELRRRRAGGSS